MQEQGAKGALLKVRQSVVSFQRLWINQSRWVLINTRRLIKQAQRFPFWHRLVSFREHLLGFIVDFFSISPTHAREDVMFNVITKVQMEEIQNRVGCHS